MLFCTLEKYSSLDWYAQANYHGGMNWQTLIAEIRERGVKLDEIRGECGFASKGHVHDLANNNQRSVVWEIGDALIKMHRRVMRRKVKL